jgi:PilZ domain
MRTERRREPRYPFVARAEIVDERENARTSSKISDLSRHGCYVEMMNPFPQGTNVVIEIYTDDEFLEVHGTVAYFEPKQGMGLTFDEMPPYFASVLNKWLAQVNGKVANQTH